MANQVITPLLLILLATTIFSFTQATRPDAVLDTDGNELLAGQDYYILPVVRGRGGGLTLDSRPNKDCPLYVAQASQEVDNGLPTAFFPVTNDKIVRLSTDLNVQFNASTICVQSTVWTLSYDEVTGRRYVAAGAEMGNPGIETLSNWFNIQKSGEKDYKLVFCPTVCDFCRPICGEMGVFVEDDKRWLGLSGDEFPVMFKRSLEGLLMHKMVRIFS